MHDRIYFTHSPSEAGYKPNERYSDQSYVINQSMNEAYLTVLCSIIMILVILLIRSPARWRILKAGQEFC